MSNEKIEQFINCIDYSRVQTIMETFNWTYRGEAEIPTISELRKTARYVIEHALDTNSDRVATGGFVFHNTPTYKELCFRLEGQAEWGL